MARTARIDSELTSAYRADGRRRAHRLPVCPATGLARYRDRHQARDGAKGATAGSSRLTISPFACPDCRGFHLDTQPDRTARPVHGRGQSAPSPRTEPAGTRRYVLVDIENVTHGAKDAPTEVAALWQRLEHAARISEGDHVVVGAARKVARRYRHAVHGAGIRWVVGADAPDGADHALLAAIDLHRVAKRYDELVIVSGDHCFEPLARRAKAHGLTVRVVTAENADPRCGRTLSRRLASAADTCTRVHRRTRAHERAITAMRTVARCSARPAVAGARASVTA
ncbi:NYN domain-containing protein [Cellulomonas xiejunii]|uniref:NYN domain-containing protein n=1 Tax=Cellulomonas xiejunii TaxID=2968083 RepID=UPI001D0EFBD7|nr:NYN domain-containing protein [Cellulomonas xiejunii]MCC2314168.1 NYN domain-containing protein [Cellulomonas xiejunii]